MGEDSFRQKILVFSIFHITSLFLCVTLRLAAPCGPSGSLRSGNPTTSSRAHLASALKSTAVFRVNATAIVASTLANDVLRGFHVFGGVI
jgi:hypothetical protein